jgi:purine-binding chemotaxis protein CheW
MSDDTTTRQLVVFSLGEEEYALPIGRVQEILFYTPPRPVSSGEPWVTGVISLRGKIIAVYDLAARLGVAREPNADAKIVIVEAGAHRAGIVVDDVAEVLTVSDADLEELPSATEHELLEAIAKVDDRLVVLLDLDHLVPGGAAAELAPASAPAPVAA